ncbi:hypothetical protein L484_025407 [Morus notabilis]|uniref:Uncharacterized protein n=1 Tax=Morus notabilis TaxID=981085 RepID=W9R2H1_9ROSA|nr:hypothetical protein L484_025407 [Morus notabilis]
MARGSSDAWCLLHEKGAGHPEMKNLLAVDFVLSLVISDRRPFIEGEISLVLGFKIVSLLTLGCSLYVRVVQIFEALIELSKSANHSVDF